MNLSSITLSKPILLPSGFCDRATSVLTNAVLTADFFQANIRTTELLEI